MPLCLLAVYEKPAKLNKCPSSLYVVCHYYLTALIMLFTSDLLLNVLSLLCFWSDFVRAIIYSHLQMGKLKLVALISVHYAHLNCTRIDTYTHTYTHKPRYILGTKPVALLWSTINLNCWIVSDHCKWKCSKERQSEVR